MVARRAVALTAVVMAVVVITVAGNYTVAKDEVKQQYKDHAEESVENTKESGRWWAGWGKDRIKEWLGLKGDVPAAIDDDGGGSDRPPGKAEKIGSQATGNVGEGEEIKDTVKQKQKQEGYDDANKMAGETINSAACDQREVDDISHCVSDGGLPREEL